MTTNDQPASLVNEAALKPSRLDFPVVGIGASAGGIPALQAFFKAMPADCGMAFVVVLHLSPRHASNLVALLQAVTKLAVLAPEDPTPIERNHVYVIAPNRMLAMNDSYLSVNPLERPQGRQVTIDLFFRTLAVVHRERAFAVVLSGAGSDGAVGIRRIKEEGGVTLAQQPQEAEFDAMPRAAITTGAVDWVLPVADMPRKLLDLWANARAMELPGAVELGLRVDAPPSAEAIKDAEEALRDVLVLLRARTGHDFRNYKRATVLRRLERRMQVNGVPNLPAYRAFLQANADEANALLKDLLIGVTNFFRDAEAFELLQRQVVPELMEQAVHSPAGLRAWVAGCATGEEAYSIAMLLTEQAAQLAQPPKIHVFATDIDEAAIGTARLGCYPSAIETDVSPSRLRRFFDKEGHQYRIRKEVREKVMFAAHNILRDPPFSRLDLISCRNLLIYLDRDVHGEILEMFHFALKPGGYLFLGSSESADTASQLFSVVDKKNRVFRANPVTRTPRYVPTLATVGSASSVAPAGVARPEKRSFSFAELHHRLAEQYAPPSVLLDAEGLVVHLSEQAGRFLRYGGGAPSHRLLDLVQPELRLELRTALFQAASTGKSVEARRVHLGSEGRPRYVTMTVRPVQETGAGAGLSLVLFDEVEDSMAGEAQVPDAQGRDPLVAQLEDELRRVKEQLQATIEQSETSNEELKASNEELQAINEELRSTTEELETSKEELQSINEELITVNHELKTKVEETGKINDDLQNLIASTDIATVFVDRAMSIKRFTPHATKLFNLIPTDVGRSLLDITHKLDYPTLADDAVEAFQSLRLIEREVRTQDGRWYLARVLPYRTTEDRIEGAVLTFIDITGRREAEETMRLLAESTKDYAILTCDTEGRITTWNPGAERVFGWSAEEAVGQSMNMLFTPEDLAAGMPQQERAQARDSGRSEDDRWHLRKDGSRFYCSGTTTPLYEKGELRGYGKIARDLTGSKRAEAEREALLQRTAAGRAQAQAANEIKDEFMAVLSHELKNPLNLIQLSAELLLRMPEARALPVVVRAAETIQRTVRSQAQIIEDLLDLSRLHTGKLALHRTGMDWSVTVRTIAEAMLEEATGKRITLALELPEGPVMLDADPVRMEQVVWNLLTNALKFTPEGGHVGVALRVEQGQAELQVRDTGRGIAPEALPQVFDMFKQAEPGTRRRGGLGIGLALVRSLVQGHGGQVRAESAGLDHGSCFSVRLPLAGQAPLDQGHAGAASGSLRGRHVLLVDDDAQALELLRQLLELEGASVQAACTAAEALELVQQRVPDLLVTDLVLRGTDGLQLLQALRQNPALKALPVIALTGVGRPGDARRAIAAGFAAHLRKPVTLDKLLATLRDVLPPQQG
ncbi:CheR family methyltransferase [Azohydromonas caseinilytica]|uniref:PAS domain S-box protein n=1 Tax=Azohydromonas caseinilytica TaxID=2728836 RepID=A0A848F7K1_9BURK|nr:CheR family methyltransferase [Azohydromonas caseinilytica]NML16077.1 PAS domain S-box protein [Azohydromonas caseinilytica]